MEPICSPCFHKPLECKVTSETCRLCVVCNFIYSGTPHTHTLSHPHQDSAPCEALGTQTRGPALKDVAGAGKGQISGKSEQHTRKREGPRLSLWLGSSKSGSCHPLPSKKGWGSRDRAAEAPPAKSAEGLCPHSFPPVEERHVVAPPLARISSPLQLSGRQLTTA